MEQLLPEISGLLYILLLGAFVKIVTALSIFKQGLGLQGAGFSMAIVGLAIVLSLFVMQNQVVNLQISTGDVKVVEKQLTPFFSRHADPEITERFTALGSELAEQEAKKSSAVPAAFLITELREAFQIGFVILLPFVVIDLLVANILILLGATQFSYAVVSLPLKLLLFIGIDGWTLLSEKLLQGYI